MTTREAEMVFEELGANFMTPDVLEHGWASCDVAYEISTGTGFAGEGIWGVTFRNKWNPTQTMDYSSMVMSLDAAYEYVESVTEELEMMPKAMQNEQGSIQWT